MIGLSEIDARSRKCRCTARCTCRRAVSSVLSLALVLGAITALPVCAEDENLLKAIQEYRLRRFEDAAADLGAAMPTEFNNPYLHYYMANCMVHLRHQDAAIREYRIAYALQPDGQVGVYCKLCLDRFGIDAEGRKASEPKPTPRVDPRRTSAWPLPAPPSAAELADLRANPRDGSASAVERERSVDNLRDLMQQRKRPLGAPLPSKVGTNLYVRNYKDIPGAEADKPNFDPPTSSDKGDWQSTSGPGTSGGNLGPHPTAPGAQPATESGPTTGAGSHSGHGQGSNSKRGPANPRDKWSLYWW